MTIAVNMAVNGQAVGGIVESRTRFVGFLGLNRGLTGTHVGCDTSQCGACVVHVDGEPVKSYTMLAAQADGSNVLTTESLATEGELHLVRAAFRKHHRLQCGFRTPGMLVSAVESLTCKSNPTEPEIRGWLVGNLCRCTG